MPPLPKKFTLSDLRAARASGEKVPMLTCYDYSTARLMDEAGVPAILVGDSAANVILGHPTTLPVPLSFMIEITAAVRRGAPNAFLVGDMPFGSYQASTAQGVRNVCKMVQNANCDAVKLEVERTHAPLVEALTAAGVAVVVHLGLRPQAVAVLGGYKAQGRSLEDAREIVALALQMERYGAAAILLEAVPPEVASAVVGATGVPVIGCGAGPACHSCVIVTHDGIGLSGRRPRFVPELADVATPMRLAFERYVHDVRTGAYPAEQHGYSMPPEDREQFQSWIEQRLTQQNRSGALI